MNQKTLPKLSRGYLLLIATAVVSGLCFFAPPNWGTQPLSSGVSPEKATQTETTPVKTVQPTASISSGVSKTAISTPTVVNNAQASSTQQTMPVVSDETKKQVEELGGKGWLEKAYAAIEASEYNVRFHDEKGVYTSPNRAQNLRFNYSKDGFSMQPRVEGSKWNLSMNLNGKGSLKPSTHPTFESKGSELMVHHNGFSVQYVNNKEGMRQNFIVHQDPSVDNNLSVHMNVAGTVTASQPGLSGIEFLNEKNEIVASYKDLKVWDATGKALKAEMKLEGTEVILAVNDINAVYPVTIDPISCSPNWTGVGFNRENDRYGYSTAVIGTTKGRLANRTLNLDANNRSYQDVVIGAPYYDGLGFNRGAAFVYYGGPGGLSAAASWIREGYQDQELFGYSVASAGDFYTGFIGGGVSSATYADLVVGAPQHSTDNFVTRSQEGRFYVYAGSAGGLVTAVNDNMSKANDIFGVNFWATSDLGEAAAQNVTGRLGAQTGFSLDGGDFGGAVGQSDIAVGSPGYAGNGAVNGGQVTVYFGGAAWPGTGPVPTDPADNILNNDVYRFRYNAAGGIGAPQLGFSVACAGDINLDNSDEIVAGAPYFDNNVTQIDEGAVFYLNEVFAANVNRSVTLGAIPGNSLVLEGNQAGALLGFDVTGEIFDGTSRQAGNYANGRLAISAPYFDGIAPSSELNEGAFAVINNPVNVFTTTHNANNAGARANVPFTTIASNNGNFVCESNQVGALLGYSLSHAGSVNGDNFGDLLVGSPFMEGPTTADLDEGTVTLYYGSATGFSCGVNRCIFEGDRVRGEYGTSVAGGNRGAQGGVTEYTLNDDVEYADILIGAPGWDVNPTLNTNTNEGRAYVRYGAINPTVTFVTTNNFFFCPNTAPVIQARVTGLTNGDQFTVYLQEALEFPYRTATFTYVQDGSGGMTFNLPTSVRAGNTAFTFQYIDVNTCCRYNVNLPLNGLTQTVNATFVTPANNGPVCQGIGINPTVNLTGFVAGDVYTVNYKIDSTGVTYTTTGTFVANPVTLTGHPVSAWTTFNNANTTRMISLLSVTRSNLQGACNTVLTTTRNVIVRPAPKLTVTPLDFCPGGVPGFQFRYVGFLGGCPDLGFTYKVNGGVTNTVAALNLLLYPGVTIVADTATFIVSSANIATYPNMPVSSLLPVTFELTTISKFCVGFSCPYTPAQLGIATTYTSSPTNQQPDVQFSVNPIYFCNGSKPDVRVDIDNVGVSQQWEIGWREYNATTLTLSTLLVSRGTGDPNYVSLTDNLVEAKSPATGYPQVQFGSAKYYLEYIIAGGCTTNYAGPSYIADAIAINALATNPSFQFLNVPAFCRGTSPTVKFDMGGIPANYPFRFTGRIYIPATQQTIPFTSKLYTGAGSNYDLDNLTINGVVEPTLRTQPGQWQYFIDQFFNATGTPTCSTTVLNASTATTPVTPVVLNFRTPAPTYCLGGSPTLEVFLPTGTWGFSYIESPLGGIPVTRTANITAQFGGWYTLATGSISATQVTYSFDPNVTITQLNGCAGAAGTSVTHFATPANALPMVALNSGNSFCQGTAPMVSLNVTNVPPMNMGTWRITYREGVTGISKVTAPMSGPMSNFMLPTTVGQSDVTIFIDKIEIIGGCSSNLALSRTYTMNPLPAVNFVTPLPTIACGGVVPDLFVMAASVPGGQSYRVDWTINGVAQVAINRLMPVTGMETFKLPVSPNILVNSTYRITQITNTSTGCVFVPSVAVSTINLQVGASALPTAAFTAAVFNYCPNTMPTLSISVTNVPVNESWTIEYEALNADNTVRYVDTKMGVGVNANFTFMPAQMPITETTTYRIRYIRNNVNGCMQPLSSVAVAANTVLSSPVTITQPLDVCVGNNPSLTLNVPGIANNQQYLVSWRENGVDRSQFGVGPMFNLTPTGNYSTPGPRTVQVLSIFFFGAGSPTCAPNIDMTVRTFNVVSGATSAMFAVNNIASVCMGTVPMVNVMVPNAANVTLRYRINNGPVLSTQVNNVSMVNIAAVAPIVANTTYSLVDITAGNCFANLNTSFEVKATMLPMAAWNGAVLAPVCSSPRLSANISMIDDITHAWTITYRLVGNPTLQTVSGMGNINGFSFAPNPLPGVGTFQYELVSITNNTTNCSSALVGTQTIQVVNGPFSPVTISLSASSVCAGTVPSVNVLLPGVAVNNAWSLVYSENGGPNKNASGVGPNGSISLTGNFANPGTYTVSISSVSIANASCNPTAMDSKTFTVVAAPDATLPVASQTVCVGSTVQVPVNVTTVGAGATVLTYSINGVNQLPVVVTNGTNNLSIPVTGTTMVRLVSISNGSCTRTFNPQPMHTINVSGGLSPVIAGSTNPNGCASVGTITANGNNGQIGLNYTLFTTNNVQVGQPVVSNIGSHTFTNLGAGSYYVRVSDASGCQVNSAAVTLATIGAVTPTITGIVDGGSSVQVSWTAITNGAAYVLEYRDTQNANFTALSTNNTTIQVSGIQSGRTYEFRVRSACSNFSAVSMFNGASLCATNPIIAVPTGFQSRVIAQDNISKTIELSWNDVPGAKGFVISWRNTSSGGTVWQNILKCAVEIPLQNGRRIFNFPGAFNRNVVYEARVRTQCDNCGVSPSTPGSSFFTNIIQFRLDEAGNVSLENTSDFNVYPNPNNGSFTVNFESLQSENVTLRLFDNLGRKVFETEHSTTQGINEVPVDIKGQATGIYQLQMIQGGETRTVKIVVN